MELNTVLVLILCVGWLGSMWVLSGVAERWHSRYLALSEELDRIVATAEARTQEDALDPDFLERMRCAMVELMSLPGAQLILDRHGIKRDQRDQPSDVSHGN